MDEKEYKKEWIKKWRKNNPQKYKEKMKRDYEKRKLTKTYIDAHRKRNRKYSKKYPEKVRAKNLANKIPFPRGMLCQVCKKLPATERHHPDYSNPLYFLFVCKKCHTKLDKEKALLRLYWNERINN